MRKTHEEFQKLLSLWGFRAFVLLYRSFVLTCDPQADVEEYLGGADADVEATLKSFQDALAYAQFFTLLQWKVFILWEAQQVPLHGLESNSTASELGRKNPGYQENSRYGRILTGEKGQLVSIFTSTAPC